MNKEGKGQEGRRFIKIIPHQSVPGNCIVVDVQPKGEDEESDNETGAAVDEENNNETGAAGGVKTNQENTRSTPEEENRREI